MIDNNIKYPLLTELEQYTQYHYCNCGAWYHNMPPLGMIRQGYLHNIHILYYYLWHTSSTHVHITNNDIYITYTYFTTICDTHHSFRSTSPIMALNNHGLYIFCILYHPPVKWQLTPVRLVHRFQVQRWFLLVENCFYWDVYNIGWKHVLTIFFLQKMARKEPIKCLFVHQFNFF